MNNALEKMLRRFYCDKEITTVVLRSKPYPLIVEIKEHALDYVNENRAAICFFDDEEYDTGLPIVFRQEIIGWVKRDGSGVKDNQFVMDYHPMVKIKSLAETTKEVKSFEEVKVSEEMKEVLAEVDNLLKEAINFDF